MVLPGGGPRPSLFGIHNPAGDIAARLFTIKVHACRTQESEILYYQKVKYKSSGFFQLLDVVL